MPIPIPTCGTADPPGAAAYTMDDFMAMLKACADELYIQPIIDAGEGNGLEVFTQAMRQFMRVSQAIERTLESMYLLPYSGQTAPEARGEQRAQVPLVFTRAPVYANVPLVLSTALRVQEVEIEPAQPEGIEVTISRYYNPRADLVFNSGETGSKAICAVAERPGYGYNNPRIDTLTRIPQPGTGLSNVGASITVSSTAVWLVTRNEPDVPIPEHVGQYVLLAGGANLGRIARAIGYVSPNPTADTGGSLQLERVCTFRFSMVSGQFVASEAVQQVPDNGARGRVLAQTGTGTVVSLSVVIDAGVFAAGAGKTLVGAVSGSVMDIDPATAPETGLDDTAWIAETGTVDWRVLDWGTDLGITVTNPMQPVGGRLGMLDELGRERGVLRLTGETDTAYRARAAEIADIVSPNAVQRAVNRTLLPYGMRGVVKEVGTDAFPGFFYDAGSSADPTPERAHNFAYDMDFINYAVDRWKVYLSFEEMRGFFIVEIAPSNLGEFGFAYDTYPWGAYDATSVLNFYDGYALGAAQARRRLWDTLKNVVAVGVDYDFVQAP